MAYKAKKINGKRVDEHRLVMEKHLGRKLKSSEVVHHIDGDGMNNKLSNLMLFPTKSAHSKYHMTIGDYKLKNGSNKKKLWNDLLECQKCKIHFPLRMFVKNPKAHLGVEGRCKDCYNSQRRNRRERSGQD